MTESIPVWLAVCAAMMALLVVFLFCRLRNQSKKLATIALELREARRQSLPQNREKNVEVVIARRSEGIFVVITDPGAGFDWKSWITVDPARAGDSHGRGIARARGLSFDSIAFNAEGNQVAAHTRDMPEQKW